MKEAAWLCQTRGGLGLGFHSFLSELSRSRQRRPEASIADCAERTGSRRPTCGGGSGASTQASRRASALVVVYISWRRLARCRRDTCQSSITPKIVISMSGAHGIADATCAAASYRERGQCADDARMARQWKYPSRQGRYALSIGAGICRGPTLMSPPNGCSSLLSEC